MMYRLYMRAYGSTRWRPVGFDCYSRADANSNAVWLIPPGAAFLVRSIKAPAN